MEFIALRRASGFTLVEVVTVIVILGVLSVVAVGKFRDLGEAAENAKVDTIFASVNGYIASLNGIRYTLAGSPNNTTYVDIDGISLRYRNGLARNTLNASHVPPGTPNRNNQATRFWYMIFSAPPPVIARNDTSSAGWAMYTGTAQCGINRSRCWKYRRAGTELAVITYEFASGSTTLVKNF